MVVVMEDIFIQSAQEGRTVYMGMLVMMGLKVAQAMLSAENLKLEQLLTRVMQFNL